MKNSFVVLIVAFGLSLSAYADVYRWIGGDGRWGDKTNWRNDTKALDGESCPGVGDEVKFWAGKSVTVTIDGNYSVYRLELMTGTSGKPDTVILTGDGSLTVGEADGSAGVTTLSYFNVYAYRCLKIFGIELSVVSGVQYVFHFAEMVVGEGSLPEESSPATSTYTYPFISRQVANFTNCLSGDDVSYTYCIVDSSNTNASPC